jgi:hypothetical protein
MWVVNKHSGLRKPVQCHLPQCAWKGESCSSGSCTGELWVNKAWRARWVLSSPLTSAEIKPPATAGWQQQAASHSCRYHSQNCLQFSPYLWWEKNRTTPACCKTSWNCIAFELGTLCGFLFFLVVCGFVHFMLPLWWDNYRPTSEAPSPELETEGQTTKLLRQTSLHLKLEVF